ncbi:hypothetical protein [Polymorphobacter sp.]|uniref:hypothetical protein n=1 Tax=Polymorphobacter sp. TaxID=1909290 RepID=UPI003F706A70
MRMGMTAVAALLLASSGAAQPRAGGVPEPVKARINEMVTQCLRAGGTLGAMTGQGQFVIPRDFNGDGQVDFVVSEGNFPCAGQPALFRPGGLARLQLYLAGGSGATLVFEDRLLAYRVLDGNPARLQIARRGPACGGAARCGDELRWNAAARRFEEVATDGRAAAVRPATLSGAALLSAPVAAGGTTPPAAAAGPAAPALPVVAGAEAAFKAQCRKDNQARYPGMSAANLASLCTGGWGMAVAAGPVAEALLAAVPVRPGEALTLSDLQARLPQVRWRAGGKAHANAPDATGMFGALTVSVTGTPTARNISVGWREREAELRYDPAAAMAARGAKVTALGCSNFGPSEVNRVYVVEAPGRAPFGLEVYSRGAAMGGQDSWQNMQANLSGPLPTLASLRAANRDPAWQAKCPF